MLGSSGRLYKPTPLITTSCCCKNYRKRTMMILSLTFLTIIFGARVPSCEGKPCFLSNCLHHGCMKWILPKDDKACTQISLGGFISHCPDDSTSPLFDKPYIGLPLGRSKSPKISSTIATKVTAGITCPPNMVFGKCKTAATCEDPTGQWGSDINVCLGDEGCVCQAGFLLKGEICVPPNNCGCFLSELEGVIPSNEFYINPDCSKRCDCRENELVCKDDYLCSSYSTCEMRNNLLQCYCEDGYIGNGQNCMPSRDCLDIFNAGYNKSGIYTIKPTNWSAIPFEVYCNMTNGGGWTVLQRRVNGSVDFYRGWKDYKEGFGFLSHEYWLGNDKINNLTNQEKYDLRIDLVDSFGSSFYATYDLFRIANEDGSYKMTELGTFNGTTGFDAMKYHRGRPFSTYDRDNDENGNGNCAEDEHGAWWYGLCHHSNLNGGYFEGGTRSIKWYDLSSTGFSSNIHYTEMKIRRRFN